MFVQFILSSHVQREQHTSNCITSSFIVWYSSNFFSWLKTISAASSTISTLKYNVLYHLSLLPTACAIIVKLFVSSTTSKNTQLSKDHHKGHSNFILSSSVFSKRKKEVLVLQLLLLLLGVMVYVQLEFQHCVREMEI